MKNKPYKKLAGGTKVFPKPEITNPQDKGFYIQHGSTSGRLINNGPNTSEVTK